MERLTKRVTVEDRTFLTYVGKENPYEMELTIGEMQRKQIEHVMSRLEDYENAEEQGLSVMFPIRIGIQLFDILSGSIEIAFVTKITLCEDSFEDRIHLSDGSGWYSNNLQKELGKTIFFTEEEALQALKERG